LTLLQSALFKSVHKYVNTQSLNIYVINILSAGTVFTTVPQISTE